MSAQLDGLTVDGEGYMIAGPGGEQRWEESPHEATPAWRRALEISASRRRN